MRILFIAGCLEQGKDGVGDYTRKVAISLIEKNFSVKILSLNDPFVFALSKEQHSFGSTVVEVYRVPSNVSYKVKSNYICKLVQDFKPAWISLQFVPFSFQNKGLPFSLILMLNSVSKKAKWHIMFHELWVGMNDEANVKLKIWGFVQKYLIKTLLQTLKPYVVSTQTNIYKWQLEKLGYECQIIPLLSNVHNYKEDESFPDSSIIQIAVFGNIFSNTPVDVFINMLNSISKELAVKILFKFIGKNGFELHHWKKILDSFQISYEVIGECTEKEVSYELHKTHFGIVTTPYLLLDKSGVRVVLQNHNLPALAVVPPWTVHSYTGSPLLVNDVLLFSENTIRSLLQKNIPKVQPPKLDIGNLYSEIFV